MGYKLKFYLINFFFVPGGFFFFVFVYIVNLRFILWTDFIIGAHLSQSKQFKLIINELIFNYIYILMMWLFLVELAIGCIYTELLLIFRILYHLLTQTLQQ